MNRMCNVTRAIRSSMRESSIDKPNKADRTPRVCRRRDRGERPVEGVAKENKGDKVREGTFMGTCENSG